MTNGAHRNAKLQGGNGHKYKVFKEKVTWHEAKKRCEDMGGYLATMTTKGENKFVAKLTGNDQTWLGATDEKKEGMKGPLQQEAELKLSDDDLITLKMKWEAK